jgi:hypothetical protein
MPWLVYYTPFPDAARANAAVKKCSSRDIRRRLYSVPFRHVMLPLCVYVLVVASRFEFEVPILSPLPAIELRYFLTKTLIVILPRR